MQRKRFINTANDERGAAAMLTVIFIIIILLIMTIGFIRLSLIGSRQSSDADLSSRAYFATESGLEDAKRAIRDYKIGVLDDTTFKGDECAVPNHSNYKSVLSEPDRYDIEITCMLIDIEPNVYIFDAAQPNETFKVPLQIVGASGPMTQNLTELLVEWHIDGLPSAGGDGEYNTDVFFRPVGEESLLSVPEWVTTKGYPAMLDISFFRRPTGSFTASELSSVRFYANPVDDTSNPIPSIPNYETFTAAGAAGSEDGKILEASCSPGTYLCSIRFGGPGNPIPDNADYFIQVTNLYRPTHIRMTPFVGGNQKSFAGGQANVDITARAGDVYRRVRATLSLGDTAILPDAALTSAGSICKDFAITNNPADFIGIPGTSCNP